MFDYRCSDISIYTLRLAGQLYDVRLALVDEGYVALVGLVHDDADARPGLLGGGDDLVGGQHEAVLARVAQLEHEGERHALVVRVVNGVAGGRVCIVNNFIRPNKYKQGVINSIGV